MNRTFRQLLTSTTLGTAVAVLSLPLAGGVVQAEDPCMVRVQMLREHPSVGQGGETTIEASASAAAEACAAGDYGLASAYIADAERRLTLREAQRDESGATADAVNTASVQTGGVAAAGSVGAGVSAVAVGSDGDNDDSLAENTADNITDTAQDIGDEVADAADDVGDAIADAFD
jgi:hypothetical protein